MEFKQLYVCPSCKAFFHCPPEISRRGCPQCKRELKYVPVSHEKFTQMTPEERAAFKAEVLKDVVADSAFTPQKEGKETVDDFEVSNEIIPLSGWAKGLRFVCWLIFIVFCFAALLVFASTSNANSLMGFIVSAGVFLLGFLLVAATMVFLDIAKDVRAIRSKLEQEK